MERIHTYECMLVLDNREVRNGWQALKDSVAGLFGKRGAEVVSSRRWDERRLAYPMKGQQRGTYLLTYIKSNTQQVAGIRRDLQFNEAVLRSLILQCESVPESAFEPEASFDPSTLAVDEPTPAPAPAESTEAPVADASEPAPTTTTTTTEEEGK